MNESERPVMNLDLQGHQALNGETVNRSAGRQPCHLGAVPGQDNDLSLWGGGGGQVGLGLSWVLAFRL